MTVALEARGVTRSFGALVAVADVNVSVREGTITAIIGPNGAGKTSLFNVITNIYPPDRGTVLLFGQPITGCSIDELARRGLVRTFQTARVLGGMSVLDNVLVGAHMRVASRLWQQAIGTPGARAEDSALRGRALRMLEVLGLERWADHRAVALSVGAQKLLEIARVLMARPRVLLLDEPAAGLNDSEAAHFASLLLALRGAGLTVVLVEHNMSLVMSIADEVAVLESGGVIATGPPGRVALDERVLQAYLGTNGGGGTAAQARQRATG